MFQGTLHAIPHLEYQGWKEAQETVERLQRADPGVPKLELHILPLPQLSHKAKFRQQRGLSEGLLT